MMVRLEDRIGIACSFLYNTFQFHDGAIGSYLEGINPAQIFRFQFHDGAIGSNIFFAAALRSYIFQFHDGAIGRRIGRTEGLVYPEISIP